MIGISLDSIYSDGTLKQTYNKLKKTGYIKDTYCESTFILCELTYKNKDLKDCNEKVYIVSTKRLTNIEYYAVKGNRLNFSLMTDNQDIKGELKILKVYNIINDESVHLIDLENNEIHQTTLKNIKTTGKYKILRYIKTI